MINKIIYSICFFAIFSCGKDETEVSVNELESEILSKIDLPTFPSYELTLGPLKEMEDRKPIFDSLIHELFQAGGGKLVVKSGVYFLEGPLTLKSNVHLAFEDSAIIKFSSNPLSYLPLKKVRWEGIEIYNYSPFIYAENEKNIAITGKVVFDGSADEEMANWRPLQKNAKTLVREYGKNQLPLEERKFGDSSFLRPSFMQFMGCEKILIDGVTVKNVPFWGIHPTYCKDVTIKNASINSLYLNNDGIDIDSGEEVLIENCQFICGDDAIAIKSGLNEDGWRVNKPSKNIVIRNCKAKKVLHGLAFGSDLSGGIENVLIRDVQLEFVKEKGIQFKSNLDRGGYLKDVFISNVKIDSCEIALYLTNNYHSYAGGNSPTKFSDIYLEKITCDFASAQGIQIEGLKESKVENIQLSDIGIKKENKASSIFNVSYLLMENVTVNKEKIDKDDIIINASKSKIEEVDYFDEKSSAF